MNPRCLHETLLEKYWKVTIRSAINKRRGIRWSLFLWRKRTTDSDRYINTINNVLKPKPRKRRISRHVIYGHYETAYTTRPSIKAIWSLFSNGDILDFVVLVGLSYAEPTVNMWHFFYHIEEGHGRQEDGTIRKRIDLNFSNRVNVNFGTRRHRTCVLVKIVIISAMSSPNVIF